MKFYTPWRPNHIQDVLCQMHSGQWFGFNGEQIYTNLVIHGDYPTPTQEYLESELARFQAEYDAQEYARQREAEYPSIKELVVALYDTEDRAAIDAKRAEIKKKYPKGAS